MGFFDGIKKVAGGIDEALKYDRNAGIPSAKKENGKETKKEVIAPEKAGTHYFTEKQLRWKLWEERREIWPELQGFGKYKSLGEGDIPGVIMKKLYEEKPGYLANIFPLTLRTMQIIDMEWGKKLLRMPTSSEKLAEEKLREICRRIFS